MVSGGDDGCMTRFDKVYTRLVVSDAAAAISFYTNVFEAEESERHHYDGRIAHAMLRLGGVEVAVKDADDFDGDPVRLGGTPVIMAVEVDDADAVAERFVSAGGRAIVPVQDHDYGQRAGRYADPFGHLWMIAQPL